jgi:hypothetical protein
MILIQRAIFSVSLSHSLCSSCCFERGAVSIGNEADKPTMVLAGSLRTDPVIDKKEAYKAGLASAARPHDLTKFELSPWDQPGAPSVNPTTKTIAFTVY